MPHAIARAWRWLTGEGWTFEPARVAVRVPAVLLPCLGGIAAGRPLVGILVASGAYTVGFGALYDVGGSRPLLLVGASLGIAASAIAASVVAAMPAGPIVAAVVFGWICARLASRGPGLAWLGLQCGIAAIVAASYPASFDRAALRAAYILSGGLLQSAVLVATRVGRGRAPPVVQERITASYEARLPLALAASAFVASFLPLHNAYWVPMTTLLVLRPQQAHTMTRAALRMGGTVAGVALASALLLALHPTAIPLALLVGGAAFGGYAFQRASYGFLSAFVTAYVVFLLSLAGMRESEIATARVVATVLGGAIALGAASLGHLFRRRGDGR